MCRVQAAHETKTKVQSLANVVINIIKQEQRIDVAISELRSCIEREERGRAMETRREKGRRGSKEGT